MSSPSSLETRMGLGTTAGATIPCPCASLATRPTTGKPGARMCMEFKIKNLQKTPKEHFAHPKSKPVWLKAQKLEQLGGEAAAGWEGRRQQGLGAEQKHWTTPRQAERGTALRLTTSVAKGVYSHIKASGSSPHLLNAYLNVMHPSCQQ